MRTYKIKRESGKTELIQARDFQQAERIVYGTGWKVNRIDPASSISLYESDVERAANRVKVIELFANKNK